MHHEVRRTGLQHNSNWRETISAQDQARSRFISKRIVSPLIHITVIGIAGEKVTVMYISPGHY